MVRILRVSASCQLASSGKRVPSVGNLHEGQNKERGSRAVSASAGQIIVAMCWSCGAQTNKEPCEQCGVPVGVTPVPLDRVGHACVTRDGLDSQAGLIVVDAGDMVTVLRSDGSTLHVAVDDVIIGGPTPGVENALSPAGQKLLLATSPQFVAYRGDPLAAGEVALQEVRDNLNGQRLLAIDALRIKGAADLLEQLTLTKSEKLWLTANCAAQSGDWEECFALLSGLGPRQYVQRCVLFLQGREVLRNSPAVRSEAISFLEGVGEPWMLVLAQWLEPNGDIDPQSLVAASKASMPRMEGLISALAGTGSLREYVDLAPEARALDALTASVPWPVTARDIQGRSLTYIDELIERGQLSSELIPEYRAVLDEQGAAYVTARLDPQQLSDDELEEYGPGSERQRRDFLAGSVKLTDLEHSESAQVLQLIDNALRGSHEALADLRTRLEASALSRLEATCTSIANRELPNDEVLRDRTLWLPLERELGADLVARNSQSAASMDQRAFVAWVCLRDAKKHLHSWEWPLAKERAQLAFELSPEEAIADEALNLIAAAQLQMGNVAAAYGAIERAIQGEYNLALQSNAIAVAESATPEQAAILLARLVQQAPDLDARLSAGKRGVQMWTETQGDSSLPDDFIRALRQLAVERISLDDYTEIIEILASQDSLWFGNPSNLRGSPHQNDPRTRLIRARSNDFPEFIRLLATTMQQVGTGPDQWLVDQRDQLVDVMLAALYNEQDAIGAAGVAYEMLDARLPLPLVKAHELNLLAAREHCFAIDVSESTLREDRVDSAVQSWRALRNWTGGEKERLTEVANHCMNIVGRHVTAFHREVLLVNALSAYEQMYGPEHVLVEKLGNQQFWADHWLGRVNSLRQAVTDPEVLEFVDLITRLSQGVMRQEWICE